MPGQPDLLACGDVAAVPDLTRPGEISAHDGPARAAPRVRAAAQHRGILRVGERRPYEHHDLGFVVDLGGWTSAADPLHIPLSGLPAKVVARGYHLFSLPGNRGRTAANWLTETRPAAPGSPTRTRSALGCAVGHREAGCA